QTNPAQAPDSGTSPAALVSGGSGGPFPPILDPAADDGAETGGGEPELRYVLDGIRVEGNTRTNERVIRRYIPFEANDIFDVDDPRVKLTRYRLLGTGFFKDVTLSLERGSRRGHVILVVSVVERNTLVLNDLWMGLSASADTNGESQLLSTFA